MSFPTMPDPIDDREREQDRWHPDRETLELATAGAAQVLGPASPKLWQELLCGVVNFVYQLY